MYFYQDGFEGSRVVIGDTIEVASELSKKTQETNPLKKTLFGTVGSCSDTCTLVM